MEKKYELLGDDYAINVDGKVLHRIVAIKDFGGIRKGTIGGYIEDERNLSHFGNCWIYDNAMVFDDATVNDDATVTGFAKVCGNSMISDYARIIGNACVKGYAHVNDNAIVSYHATVGSHAVINDNVFIGGDAEIFGYSILNGDIHISNNACINKSSDIITIYPALFGECVHFYKSHVKSGVEVFDAYLLFNGDINIYIKYIKLKSLGYSKKTVLRYSIMCKFVKLWFKLV